MATISIIIPAFNEEKYLSQCLQSIYDNDRPEILEVFVVDNGCSDDTVAIAQQFKYSKIHLVCELSKGPNFARQAGFKASAGDIIATIDADTMISKKWLDVLLKRFEDPKIVGLSGPYDYYDYPFVKRKFVFWLWKYLGLFSHIFTGFVVYGGNFAARKSALQKIGGFDESIVFYGDDANTGKRLSKIGKLPFDPSFTIQTSARRLKAEGMWRICWIYGVNFISEAIRGKPYTPQHRNFR
jgi:glycosyltransferase involved in cell wall biosynthesis